VRTLTDDNVEAVIVKTWRRCRPTRRMADAAPFKLSNNPLVVEKGRDVSASIPTRRRPRSLSALTRRTLYEAGPVVKRP